MGRDAIQYAALNSISVDPAGALLRPRRQPLLRRETVGGQTTVTRTFGSVEEVTRPDGVVEDRRQLGMLIETRYSNGSAPLKQYLFTDALGSVDVIASATGAVLQRMSFDPHGGRRNANDWNSAAAFVIPPYTTRGFTGHEQLDSVGLVHMGGRVYDPELGRFLQPDPMLDAGLQGLNRYSYVLNNPLALTDPSGYLSLGQLLRTVVAVAITVYTGGWAGGLWGTTLTTGQAFAVTVAGGFAAGAVQSGSLKGGLYGAFSGALFFGIGSYFDAGTQASAWARTGDKLNTIGRVSKVVAHGSAGGITSSLQGGKFAHGFASAGFSEAAGPLTQGIESQAARGVVHAMIGGTASSLSGGKFANGAVTAAMSFAFNSMAHERGQASQPARQSTEGEGSFDVSLSGSFGSADAAAIAFGEAYGPVGMRERIEYNTAIVQTWAADGHGPPAFAFTQPLAGDVNATIVPIQQYVQAVARAYGGANIVAIAHNHFDNNLRFSPLGADTSVAQIIPLYLYNSQGETRLLNSQIIQREIRGTRGARPLQTYLNSNGGMNGECIHACRR